MERVSSEFIFCDIFLDTIDFVSFVLSVCGQVKEYQTLVLTAPGQLLFGPAVFASYGTPNGTCGHYYTSSCHSNSSLAVVNTLCLGQHTCTIHAVDAVFGDPCRRVYKNFMVQMSLNIPSSSKFLTHNFKLFIMIIFLIIRSSHARYALIILLSTQVF